MTSQIDPLRPIGSDGGPLRIAASDLATRVGRRRERSPEEEREDRRHARQHGEHHPDPAALWVPAPDEDLDEHAGAYDDHGRRIDGEDAPPEDLPHIDARA